jgi:hypothetical protein
VPATAFKHFQDDIARARSIVTHAAGLPAGVLRSDLLRSGWMFAVGALDAYFCDAYTDIVAASIISKSRYAAMVLPDFFLEIKFPVRAILEPYTNNFNWRWRMAAREMMARETVLRLRTIQDLFNKFFRPTRRFFHDLLADWIIHPEAKKGVFGITRAAFLALPPNGRAAVVDAAWAQLQELFAMIFQRRHDCIHNCDRPKVAPQPLALAGTVVKVVQHVEFLVSRCNEHIDGEFREFLLGTGCPAAIVAQAGY